jgi:hypothetical protein
MAEFLQQVDFSIPEAVTFGITAAFMIGDSNRAKNLLDKIIDEDYMYANTLFFSNQPLSDSKRPLDVTGTETLLVMCVLAGNWGRGCQVIDKIIITSPSFFNPKEVNDSTQYWCRHAAAGIILERSNRACEAFSYLIQGAELSGRYREQTNNPRLRQPL